MKKILCAILALILLLPATFGCSKDDGTVTMLSFSQSQSVEEMKKLDGKQVTIIGYMSTLSPVTGKFMYLMNLPYQSCPFCIPNTTQLSNTMAVYAKDKDGFKFTDRAIQVTGKMDFGDYEDEFGYQYSYRITDATYTVLDTSEMGEKLQLWQQLASTDVIADVYEMYDYLHFLYAWPSYTMSFSDGKDYLYPNDAKNFIEKDGAQFNYGFVEGYFDDMIDAIESISETAYVDLVNNIKDAKRYANKVYKAFDNGEYTATVEYSGTFGDGRVQYKMNDYDKYDAEFYEIYDEFSAWLSSWEL